ncbi:MAG: hypothetical protein ACOVP4_08880 [Bacteriovoracaceae bacterium]|jgi:5,10-methylene-tetrahydrofolate dehydrogenase/methenyl tetrahydrofolate cyclohydrolase
MKRNDCPVSDEYIDTLKNHFEVICFSNDYDFVYENQVPNTGVILIEGEIEQIKRSKVLKKISPFTVLGIYQLFHNQTVCFDFKIKKGSKVIVIGKSDLVEVISNSKSKLFSLFKAQT